MEGRGIGMDLIWGINFFQLETTKMQRDWNILTKSVVIDKGWERSHNQKPRNQVMNTIDVIIFWSPHIGTTRERVC